MPTQPVPGAETGTSADAASSGAARLDLSALEGLTERPLSEHASVYDQLHGQLQAALNEIDRS